MDRNTAFEILKEHVKSESLLRHSFAVEAAMKAYAKKFGEDTERWAIIGLLHDVDFEKFPEPSEHTMHTQELLEDTGIGQDIIDSIVSHADVVDIPRDTKERKALYAVDQMSSFIVAYALMRPTKLKGMSAKSLKKKIKDKAFAKAVDREMLEQSRVDLGVEFADHIKTITDGLIEQEAFLQEQGYSLF